MYGLNSVQSDRVPEIVEYDASQARKVLYSLRSTAGDSFEISHLYLRRNMTN